MEGNLVAKEKEISILRNGNISYGINDKDREIELLKQKNAQIEREYQEKIDGIKAQTEGILREQIVRH